MGQEEYKYLRRKDLIEIIYELQKNEAVLEERIHLLEEELKEKTTTQPTERSLLERVEGIEKKLEGCERDHRLYVKEIKTLREEMNRQSEDLIVSLQKKLETVLATAQANRGVDAYSESRSTRE